MNTADTEVALLTRLQEWFLSECNEDWEHTYGFKLDTLDNPGWTFEADLAETEWAGIEVARERVERSEFDWVQYEISDDKYVACGGPLNLVEMLRTFFAVLEKLKGENVA